MALNAATFGNGLQSSRTARLKVPLRGIVESPQSIHRQGLLMSLLIGVERVLFGARDNTIST